MTTPVGNTRQGHEPDSPCIQLCVMHPASGLCMGCYRNSAEISAWSQMKPAERLAIMATLPARAVLITGKRRAGRGKAPKIR